MFVVSSIEIYQDMIHHDWICLQCAISKRYKKNICSHNSFESIISFKHEKERGQGKALVHTITRGEFNRLYPHEDIEPIYQWLNDNLINAFLMLIRKLDFDLYEEDNSRTRAYIAPVCVAQYFCDKVQTFEYIAKTHIYPGKNIKNVYDMSADNFYFVCNMGQSHFVLVIVFLSTSKIVLYNPYLNEEGLKVAQSIKDFFNFEYKAKGKQEISNPFEIEVLTHPYPLQTNSKDCGVFTIISVFCRVTRTIEIYTEADMPKLRLLICNSLIANKIDVRQATVNCLIF